MDFWFRGGRGRGRIRVTYKDDARITTVLLLGNEYNTDPPVSVIKQKVFSNVFIAVCLGVHHQFMLPNK